MRDYSPRSSYESDNVSWSKALARRATRTRIEGALSGPARRATRNAYALDATDCAARRRIIGSPWFAASPFSDDFTVIPGNGHRYFSFGQARWNSGSIFKEPPPNNRSAAL